MRYARMILFVIIVCVSSVGCSTPKSTIYADRDERVLFLEAGSTVTTAKGDTIIETDSVVIPEGKHAYLLRCQDYVEQHEGVLP